MEKFFQIRLWFKNFEIYKKMWETNLNLEPSAIREIMRLSEEKKAAGKVIYNLGIGEIDLPTPEILKREIEKIVAQKSINYAPTTGLPELRTTWAKFLNESSGSQFTSENICVTPGGVFALFVAISTFIKKGDEVILIAPYWTIYHNLILLAGGVPKVIETSYENNFRVDVDNLESAISSKAKMLIFNPASNPVGTIYSRNETKEILSVCVKKGLKIISDEVYSELVFDNEKFVSAASFPEFAKNLAIIQSVSKSFTMTGWRVGAILGAAEMIKTVANFTGISVACTNTVGQYLAISAFENANQIMPEIYEEVSRRRITFFQNLNEIFGTEIKPTPAGIYAFLPISLFGSKEKNSIKFCQKVLQKANVAMIPGSVFGQEGFVRCSFGGETEEAKNGLLAIKKFLRK